MKGLSLPKMVLCFVLTALALILMPASHVTAQTAEGGYKIFRPDGSGPHPSLVFLPGCSGFTPSHAPKHYERVAEQFRGKGYVVIFADYIGRRGLTNCMAVSHSEAAKDLVAAAAWLKSQPFIDPARITAIGWSYGGGAVLRALNEYNTEQLVFSRAIVYFPNCGDVWKTKVPVLMLLAGEDNVNPNMRCQEAAKKGDIPDAVKIVVYPGAYHAFDMSELPPKTEYQFGTLGYSPQATAAAWEEIERFLQSTR
jgi:dienelactone hydrolase